jgi:hypothetical protein
MTLHIAMLSRVRRFGRARRAVAFVEFAYTLPIIMVLMLGGVEVSNYVTTKMRLNQLALMAADNTARIGTGSLLAAKTISEAQINDVLTGVAMSAGTCTQRVKCLDLMNQGRIIISSIEKDVVNSTSANKKYKMGWQRCAGAKNWASTYGEPSNSGTGQNKDGFGPAGQQITSPDDDSATMLVELYYEYRPIITSRYLYNMDLTITEVASMPVRDRRDLTQVYNNEAVDQNLCNELDTNTTN